MVYLDFFNNDHCLPHILCYFINAERFYNKYLFYYLSLSFIHPFYTFLIMLYCVFVVKNKRIIITVLRKPVFPGNGRTWESVYFGSFSVVLPTWRHSRGNGRGGDQPSAFCSHSRHLNSVGGERRQPSDFVFKGCVG